MGWKAGFKLLAGLVALSACQSASTARPAVLSSDDPADLTKLKTALASAVGRAQIELGPNDPTLSSTISVLPPPPGPLETHSLAKPISFSLLKMGARCLLVRLDTNESFPLDGVACEPVEK